MPKGFVGWLADSAALPHKALLSVIGPFILRNSLGEDTDDTAPLSLVAAPYPEAAGLHLC